MSDTQSAAGEAMPKIPASIAAKYNGNQPIDELDYALDILTVARVALQSPDMGSVSERDIAAAGNLVAYALEALALIRPAVNKLDGMTRA